MLNRKSRSVKISAFLLMIFCVAQVGYAQTTTFTYQGKLSDNGNPASGNSGGDRRCRANQSLRRKRADSSWRSFGDGAHGWLRHAVYSACEVSGRNPGEGDGAIRERPPHDPSPGNAQMIVT